MNNKEHFDFLIRSGAKINDLERVRNLVDTLIQNLYKVDDTLITRVDPIRIEEFGLDGFEPINWGSLRVLDVQNVDGCYLIEIEEAAPDECPVLCNYIQKYMKSWGWDVNVRTEW